MPVGHRRPSVLAYEIKGKWFQTMLEFEGSTYVDCARFVGLFLMPHPLGVELVVIVFGESA